MLARSTPRLPSRVTLISCARPPLSYPAASEWAALPAPQPCASARSPQYLLLTLRARARIAGLMRLLLIGIFLVGGVYALPAEPELEATATPLPDAPDAEDAQDRTLKMAVLSGAVASKLIGLKKDGHDIDDLTPGLINELARKMMAEGHYEFMTRAELHEDEADEDPVELLLAALHLLQARGAPPLNWSAVARSNHSPTGRQLEVARVPGSEVSLAVPERTSYAGTIPGTALPDVPPIPGGGAAPIPGTALPDVPPIPGTDVPPDVPSPSPEG